jgi:methylglutaconyl-CoA hydratase/polyketide biosynthesis enoyl-CoA hydratase PksH
MITLHTDDEAASDGSAANDVRLDGPGLTALVDLIDAAEADDGCRALVIESASPSVFCRGMDLAFLQDHSQEDLQPRIDAYAVAMERLRMCRRPTLALVDGEVRGGGVGLAAACDVVLGTTSASFALPELVVGLVPAMVMPLLEERMSPKRARWMALTGVTLDAAAAAEHGLMDDGPHPSVDVARKAARRLVRTLRRIQPAAVGRLKDHDAEIRDLSIADGLKLGAERTGADIRDPEILAGVAAMREGELPPWAWRAPERDD